MYEEVFRTHEAASAALTDRWEKQWALDRIPWDREVRDTDQKSVRDQLASATAFELAEVRDLVERTMEAAQEILADAQEHRP